MRLISADRFLVGRKRRSVGEVFLVGLVHSSTREDFARHWKRALDTMFWGKIRLDSSRHLNEVGRFRSDTEAGR